MKLIYVANARIPSEKAHAYQIVQMCEAFAEQGIAVVLLYAQRHAPPGLERDDLWEHYGIERNFKAAALACVDLFPVARYLPAWLRFGWERLVAPLQTLTFLVSLIRRLRVEYADIIYSRDPLVLLVLSQLWSHRRESLYYEAHVLPGSRRGVLLQKRLMSRLDGLVVITRHLEEKYGDLGVDHPPILVAHDGFRRSRFAISGNRQEWRAKLGWPEDAFIVGYMGRFVGGLEQMDKGLDTLLESVIMLQDVADSQVHLALVGGPASRVGALKALAFECGMPPDFILYPGEVPPPDVPGYLRAFDVCTISSPWTEFYAYYTSPMKLFEYMASGTPIVASDLPSTAEIIRDEENGLLVQPGRAGEFAIAFQRLLENPDLGAKLANQAARDVLQYAWDARAARILEFIGQSSQVES